MIGNIWWMLRLYAEQPSTQIQWLQSGVIAALVGGVIAGAIAIIKDRSQSKIDARKVSVEEFTAHESFYEKRFAELTAQIEAAHRREKQLERDLEAVRISDREKSKQIGNLITTVAELQAELERLH